MTTPIALGIGIGNAEQARAAIAMGADGVIIGSLTVETLLKGHAHSTSSWAACERRSMAADIVVGIDLGTTTLKAGLFDTSGELLGVRASPVRDRRPRPEWAEQDPADWLRALTTGARRARRQCRERHPARSGSAAKSTPTSSSTQLAHASPGDHLAGPALRRDSRSELKRRLPRAAPAKTARFDFACLDAARATRAMDRTRGAGQCGRRRAIVLSPKDFVTAQICRLEQPVTDPITPFDLVGDDGDVRR